MTSMAFFDMAIPAGKTQSSGFNDLAWNSTGIAPYRRQWLKEGLGTAFRSTDYKPVAELNPVRRLARNRQASSPRWLHARAQSMHTEFQSDPLIREGRDAVSKALAKMATEIASGAGNELTARRDR